MIRRGVETAREERDMELSEERKGEILDRAPNRYMLVHYIGEEENNTCVDSVYASMANTGKIVNILKTRDDWNEFIKDDVAKVIDKEVEVNRDIAQYFKEGHNRIDTVVKSLRSSDKYKNDELAKIILRVKSLHEDFTGILANNVAIDIGSSGFVVRFVRRYLDANCPSSSRKIKKQSRLEFGTGYHLAQYCLLQKIFEECLK